MLRRDRDRDRESVVVVWPGSFLSGRLLEGRLWNCQWEFIGLAV